MNELPVVPPAVDCGNRAFFAAAARGVLLLRRCSSCDRISWPARDLCPFCGAAGLHDHASSGRGVVYSFTVVRKGEWASEHPYVIAYVELDEGVRVMSNVVGTEVDDVRIGLPVQVVFDEAGDDVAVYRFEPRRN
jgi:uncharacterized protein